MRTRTIPLVLFGLLAAALLAWLALAGGQGAPTIHGTKDAGGSTRSPTATELEPEQKDASTASSSGESSESRTLVAPSEAEPDLTRLDALPGDIRGLVLNDRDEPVAGVLVTASTAHEATFNSLDYTAVVPQSVVARYVSGSDGRFRLEVPPARPFDVTATADGWATVVLGAAFAGEELEVRLRRPAALQGRVTRADDGRPVEGVRIRVDHGPSQSQTENAETDSDGWYSLAQLAPGAVGIMVIPESLVMPRWTELQLEEGRSTRHDVVLEEDSTISGQVRDARSGAGIPGAEVSSWSFLGKTVRTDAAGYYRLDGLRERARTLEARAAGYGRSEGSVGKDEEQLDFDLIPGVRITGRLVDAQGLPVSNGRVSACATEDQAGSPAAEWKSAPSLEDGRFELVDVRSDVSLSLFARATGFATLVRELPADLLKGAGMSEDGGTLAVGDIALRAAATLTGVVEDPAQRGIPNGMVQLQGPEQAQAKGSLRLYTNLRSTMTDARGRFALTDLAGGTYRLRLHIEGRAAREETVDLDAEKRRHDIWTFASGRFLTVLVRDPDARPCENAVVSLAVPGSARGTGMRGRTDADGLVRFEDVPVLPFDVQASANAPDQDERWARATMSNVQPEVESLELQLLRIDSEIEGVVLDSGGRGVPDILVSNAPGEGELTRGDGSFRLEVPAGTVWTLRAYATRPLGADEPNLTILEHRLGRRVSNANEVVIAEEILSGRTDVRLTLPD